MPRVISRPQSYSPDIQSSSSSFQSASLNDSSIKPFMPQTHLKELALKHVPLHAQSELINILDLLEQNIQLNEQETFELAKNLIAQHLTQPEVIESIFKYLNCRFMLDQQEASNLLLRARDDKTLLRQSMNDLRQSSSHTLKNFDELLSGHARVGPVVTSHPTQLNRPESSERLLQYRSCGFETEQDARVFAETLWEQAGRRTEKPSVLNEAQSVTSAVRNILQSMRRNAKVLIKGAQENNIQIEKPLLEAGNWIAGDRDGNPTITPVLLGEVMGLWSKLAFEQYLHKVSDTNSSLRPDCLHNLFTQAGHLDHLTDLKNKLEATRRHVVDNAPASETTERFKNPGEFSEYIHKLKNNLDWQALSLEAEHKIYQKLDQLSLWADTFGFHGASTHIRQNSEINLQTVDALMEAAKPGTGYASLPEEEKVELLKRVLNDDASLVIPAKVQTSEPNIQKEIDFLDSYKGLRARFGDAALPTVITANTETLSDMLEVCVLLKHANLSNSAALGMNVVPLIETVPDMKNAKALLTELLNIPMYKAHLQETGNVQRVMLGYSDSMRGNGIVSAAWEGHKLPAELREVARSHGVKLHFFHGRGGTEARGSRNNYADEIAHVDGGSLEAGYTQTEQGEEVYKKFGNRTLSDNNISELISSTLQNNAKGDDMLIQVHGTSMKSISEYADLAYQNLYQDSTLSEFLQNTTPLPHVGLSNAGSRPASRVDNLNGPAFLAKLRAIPYVAAWNQSASMAPAYFGLGSGLRQHIDCSPGNATQKIAELRKMYQEWPFFKNLIDRAETAMNKADMDVAKRYAALNPSTMPVFEKVQSEYELSRTMVDLIKGQNTEQQPKQTNPLRTFAHAMQVELIRTAKNASAVDKPAVETGIAMSMQALASALGRFG